MGVISEIKCARCDRMYSGVRSRCPFCGARRGGSGKYSEGANDSKGKMLVGILIMAVLVVAAAVLLFTAPGDTGPDVESPPPTSSLPNDNDTVNVPGTPVSPPDDTAPPDDPTPPPPTVESVTITYNNRPVAYGGEFTMTLPRDRTLKLGVKIEPLGIEEKIEWSSSNPAVAEVVPTDTTGLTVTVTAIGNGTATITATVGDVTDTVTARIVGG